MKRLVFMGTPDFSVPIFEALIRTEYEVVLAVTQPDRPKGRKKIMTPPPVKETAEKHHIPVLQPEKVRDEYKKILAYEPDIIITAAYGQILPKELLDVPEFGCINVHASLLPELRGGAPIHHAILQGKDETGITIMYMVEKLDAGDVIAKQTVPIAHSDHVGSLHDKLSKTGAQLLVGTLPRLFARQITPESQNESLATFASNIKREQEKIDWQNENGVIYNHIRGLHPWPVAFTTYNGEVMKIWWAEVDDNHYAGTPGEIVQIIDDEAFIVVCGNQKGVKIKEIQPAGKKRMTVKQYLQGSPDRIKMGVVLGD
ncbi:methionyl-tRNA formyltransferase [Lentibacillus amyloliquefaciens]|uniref:Methionyl-tRNA formyltransferase n=1 Tax=Lentibacillus amyloliquefaciens TaxID=1472767 RepID=A0A0U4EA68_9BACI|nr:methionyl-tRNA formyltransferase [Lentibacillus amyloliquefaciens]ALX47417.1 methionyl-tRNA formyltransferase [Lentibacillus amyloliquefaciens]